MKTKLLISLAFLLLIAFPGYTKAKNVNAQNMNNAEVNVRIRTETQNIKNQIQARILQKRAEVKTRVQNQMEERMASKSAALTQLRKDHVKYFFGRVVVRYAAAIERLDGLTQRIEARIAVIENENPDVDTTAIKDQLGEAKVLLGDARTNLAATKDNLDTMLESEDPQIAFQVLKDNFQALKNELVQIHGILIKVITQIKGLRIGNTPALSPSPTIEPTNVPTTEPTESPTPST
ncbi:hypothetical protein A2115_00095 [Candidatus Woesebacteria bacterium GWA1_41_8]|uniref:DUF5667 domain-containing protein n=1 Tax=Candidatus Woesebacteria bacterium GWA1_41_8 TaxID=1802471 RepID=A0A1F7WJZ6_9BACT|nr:MAG: hypothetical protein A2115_00095 [Candidatus Woesebacteria bacterium GWA1_41_8]